MEPGHKPKITNNLQTHGIVRDPMNEGGYGSTKVFTIFFEKKTYLAEGPLDGPVTKLFGRVLPKPAGPQHAAGEGQCLYRHGEYTYLLEKLDAAVADQIKDTWNGARYPGPAKI